MLVFHKFHHVIIHSSDLWPNLFLFSLPISLLLILLKFLSNKSSEPSCYMCDHLPQNNVLESAEYTPLSSSAVPLPFLEHGAVIGRNPISKMMDPPEYLELEEVMQPISARKLSNYLPLRASNGRQGWKPITLKAPFLGVLVLSSLFIIVPLETLSYQSSGGGRGWFGICH